MWLNPVSEGEIECYRERWLANLGNVTLGKSEMRRDEGINSENRKMFPTKQERR